MRRIFHKSQSKTEYQNTVKEINMVDNLEEIDGNLIVTLSKPEYKSNIEKYLNILRSEMKLDDHTKKIFTFSYDEHSNCFIIKPTQDVTIKNILEEFAAVNLLDSKKHNHRHRHVSK